MGTSSGARPSTSEGLKLLIIDLETTGLDPKQGSKPIEVAAALFSVKHRDILQTVSFLLPNDKNEAEHINRIKPAITKVDQPWRSAMDFFFTMADQADYAVAHNSSFDSKWFGIDPLPALDLPWLDSMSMDWGPLSGRSLRDLALHSGLTITPDHHRAGPDVQLLAGVFTRAENLVQILDDALIPRIPYWADVSYSDRGLAKSAGFKWNPDRRKWVKDLTEAESKAFEFRCFKMAEKSSTERLANVH